MDLSPNQLILLRVQSPWGKKIYRSRVEDVNENEIIVAAPLVGTKVVPVKLGSQVTVIIKKSDLKYQGRYKVSGILKQRDFSGKVPLFHVSLKGEWQKIQERDFVRVDVLLSGAYIKLDEEHSTTEEGVDIIITDISGGGFRFTHKEKLKKNTELLFTINLPNNVLIHCEAKIMRIEQVNEIYEYGAAFIDLSEENRQKIIQFVYKRQLEIYKKISKEDL